MLNIHASVMGDLRRVSGDYSVSPLLDLAQLAAHLELASVHCKWEGVRPLGSFKSLGGTYAALQVAQRRRGQISQLICASDGNHGLAVALAARHLNLPARVFVHAHVAIERIARITQLGAHVEIVPGTFDDAVAAAAALAARDPKAALIPDTSEDPDDPVIGDVLAGYGVIGGEARMQFAQAHAAPPTHIFIQAGVGGLAASMAIQCASWLAAPGKIVVVEPQAAACVGAALAAGVPTLVAGDLETSAAMLSCGLASARALRALQQVEAQAMTVSERELEQAPVMLERFAGLGTTPSGATGLAGLAATCGSADLRTKFQLSTKSRVLLVISEGR